MKWIHLKKNLNPLFFTYASSTDIIPFCFLRISRQAKPHGQTMPTIVHFDLPVPFIY